VFLNLGGQIPGLNPLLVSILIFLTEFNIFESRAREKKSVLSPTGLEDQTIFLGIQYLHTELQPGTAMAFLS
jgi:hypothetical protein